MIVHAYRMTSDHGRAPPFILMAEHGEYCFKHPVYHSDDVPEATQRIIGRVAEMVAADLGLPPRGWPDGVPYPIESLK